VKKKVVRLLWTPDIFTTSEITDQHIASRQRTTEVLHSSKKPDPYRNNPVSEGELRENGHRDAIQSAPPLWNAENRDTTH